MIYTTASKRFYLSPGVTCICNIPVPDLNQDPNQAKGLGKTYSEKNENLDRFLTEIFYPQYTRSLKEVIRKYQNSELPDKFLYDQTVIVEPISAYLDDVLGLYDHETDTIILDADALSIGFKSGTSEFLYGHETGHRILHYKPSRKAEAIQTVMNILSISDSRIAEELLCDAFGYLVNPCGESRLDIFQEISPLKKRGLALAALKLAWS